MAKPKSKSRAAMHEAAMAQCAATTPMRIVPSATQKAVDAALTAMANNRTEIEKVAEEVHRLQRAIQELDSNLEHLNECVNRNTEQRIAAKEQLSAARKRLTVLSVG